MIIRQLLGTTKSNITRESLKRRQLFEMGSSVLLMANGPYKHGEGFKAIDFEFVCNFVCIHDGQFCWLTSRCALRLHTNDGLGICTQGRDHCRARAYAVMRYASSVGSYLNVPSRPEIVNIPGVLVCLKFNLLLARIRSKL